MSETSNSWGLAKDPILREEMEKASASLLGQPVPFGSAAVLAGPDVTVSFVTQRDPLSPVLKLTISDDRRQLTVTATLGADEALTLGRAMVTAGLWGQQLARSE